MIYFSKFWSRFMYIFLSQQGASTKYFSANMYFLLFGIVGIEEMKFRWKLDFYTNVSFRKEVTLNVHKMKQMNQRIFNWLFLIKIKYRIVYFVPIIKKGFWWPNKNINQFSMASTLLFYEDPSLYIEG